MTSIFWDASGMVPLAVTRDQWRTAIERVVEGLRRGGTPRFVTSNWTLYEALAQAHRAGHAVARSLYNYIERDFTIIPIRQPIEEQALHRFLNWHDKTASVVDHANLLAAVDFGCEAIISFDSDFQPLARAAGLRLLS